MKPVKFWHPDPGHHSGFNIPSSQMQLFFAMDQILPGNFLRIYVLGQMNLQAGSLEH